MQPCSRVLCLTQNAYAAPGMIIIATVKMITHATPSITNSLPPNLR